ncbi:MAG: helix-turn-helix domain-containing protein [Acidimicrobiales bacterium]|nr:helix-turn-helix domain-containing protein [Acidimicrobiales bacterium]
MTPDHPLRRALEPVADALGAALVEPIDMQPGDIPLRWQGEVVGGFRQPGLHDALERLLDSLEVEYGSPLADLDREDKQAVVARLDDLGAFVIRKAAEDVADRLDVSRFTVYNYLNARDTTPNNRERR